MNMTSTYDTVESPRTRAPRAYQPLKHKITSIAPIDWHHDAHKLVPNNCALSSDYLLVHSSPTILIYASVYLKRRSRSLVTIPRETEVAL